MKKLLTIIIAVMLFALPAVAEGSVLTVRGTGIVNAEADMATIILGVREVSEDVATAQATVNEKIDGVVQALMDAGISIDDISTQSISIYPERDYSAAGNPITGYTAENTLAIRTNDIDNAGRYIDAAFSGGANELNDISFSAHDTTEESERALALALENARNKAEALAEASGMKLGAIRSIAEEAYGYDNGGALYERAADAAAGMTKVYASQLTVSASVTVEFELLPMD